MHASSIRAACLTLVTARAHDDACVSGWETLAVFLQRVIAVELLLHASCKKGLLVS